MGDDDEAEVMSEDESVKRVIMDTNHWIDLKKYPERLPRFAEAVDRDDVKVILSFGNFIDLVRSGDDDILPRIVGGKCDYCLPVFREGDSYPVSDDPVDLVPPEYGRSFFAEELRGENPIRKLQYLIRYGDSPAPEGYDESVKQYKEMYEEYGHDNLKGHTFREYLKEQDGNYVLDPDDVDPVSYVQSEVVLHRLRLLQPEENPDPHDIADLQLCIQAILSDCNMLLIEKKWVNEELVESVLESLGSDKDLAVYKDFEVFLSDLKK